MDYYEESEDFEEYEFEDEDLAAIDAILETLCSNAQNEESSVYVMDMNRVEHMKFAYMALKKALINHGENTKIVCEQDKIIPYMGHVSVEAESIGFSDMDWLARAAQYADNTEIYPLMGNKVRLTLGFNRLLVPMD